MELIKGILENNALSKSDGERLRGRLQFASNQVFGRRFKNCLRELNIHVSRGFKTVSAELANALKLMASLLELNQPRQVDVNFLDWVHLYVDASFEPSGHSGVGGVLCDSVGSCLACFSERVNGELLKCIFRPEQKSANSNSKVWQLLQPSKPSRI